MEGPQAYQYEPLRDDEIRIFELVPGDLDEDIKVHLHHYSLQGKADGGPTDQLSRDDVKRTLPDGWDAFRTPEGVWLFEEYDGARVTNKHPTDRSWGAERTKSGSSNDFEALSYVWGSNDDRKHLYIVAGDDGLKSGQKSILPITKNLDVALRALRYQDSCRALWVDAICINQNDLAERALQVPRMGNIYSSAKRVIAWLGPSVHDSHLALETMEHLGKQVEISDDRWSFPAMESQELTWWQEDEKLPWTESQWSAVVRLMSRP